jgi:hypothetical protein
MTELVGLFLASRALAEARRESDRRERDGRVEPEPAPARRRRPARWLGWLRPVRIRQVA